MSGFAFLGALFLSVLGGGHEAAKRSISAAKSANNQKLKSLMNGYFESNYENSLYTHLQYMQRPIVIELEKKIDAHKHEYSEKYTPFMTNYFDNGKITAEYFKIYHDWRQWVIDNLALDAGYYCNPIWEGCQDYETTVRITRSITYEMRNRYGKKMKYFDEHGDLPTYDLPNFIDEKTGKFGNDMKLMEQTKKTNDKTYYKSGKFKKLKVGSRVILKSQGEGVITNIYWLGDCQCIDVQVPNKKKLSLLYDKTTDSLLSIIEDNDNTQSYYIKKGTKVNHQSFGDGIITSIYDSGNFRYIDVKFENKEMTLVYPDAFSKGFLTIIKDKEGDCDE